MFVSVYTPAGFRDIQVVAEASSIEKWRKQVLAAIGAIPRRAGLNAGNSILSKPRWRDPVQ